jgi:hypothetical protein
MSLDPEIEALVRDGNSSQKVALRRRLLLLANQGAANHAIAQQRMFRDPRFWRPCGLCQERYGGHNGNSETKQRAKTLTSELEQKILDTRLQIRPEDGGTHWSVCTLAKHLGISLTIVHRVWQRHDVQPHRVERFKLSNDPHFEEKVREIVDLYLNPCDRALVLCFDEKGQIQASADSESVVEITSLLSMAVPRVRPKASYSLTKVPDLVRI